MVRPKKHLGQHFLHDENIARKIMAAVPAEPALVLEIGPGTGVLSKYLLNDDTHDPFFLEVDHESAAYLLKKFPSIERKLIIADFLKYRLDTFPDPGRSSEPITLLGNFPYNISSQILFRAVDNRSRVRSVIGMFQKEVAERVIEKPGNKSYGILSVIIQAFYDAEYLFSVSESVFVPPPKVKSAVIRLTRNTRESLGCDEQLFIRVVKTAFNQRRKTLHNALKPITADIRDEAGLPYLRNRAEQLSVEDFILLTREILQRTP
ncbi:MAG: 16S rRNA (adenine(1518)-N(6)/adenine(1519)-N(6))-dimethyltransferase RsmA [Bacteroidetes bacterium]|nr:MAG: 16S rRNA (adenine(1518)-N(6)/adenine(1519)-N(6))-dimethyltransferase RsmA [Bacteroidota bacterium]